MRDDGEFARQLGMLLRATRMARGQTLAQVSAAFPGHLTAPTLRTYEAGTRDIPVGQLEAIAAFYGVPPAEFIPPPPCTPRCGP